MRVLNQLRKPDAMNNTLIEPMSVLVFGAIVGKNRFSECVVCLPGQLDSHIVRDYNSDAGAFIYLYSQRMQHENRR